MRAVRAFSIIELLTALVLLAVGLAAFVRAAGAVARLDGDARLTHRVAEVLQARLDSLRRTCGAAQAGETRHDGVHERWQVAPEGWLLRFTDTLDVPSRPALSRRIAASVRCRP